MATRVVSASIDEALAKRLDQVAADTNRKKSYFINQALKEYFEELEDYEVALSRRGGTSTPVEDAERELGSHCGRCTHSHREPLSARAQAT